MVLDMWGLPHIILNLTFSPTENAQYFTIFKLDTRRCENPILAWHYILHPQPPQNKSCTCFYADYSSILGENVYIYIYIYIYTITRKTCSPEGYRRNEFQPKYIYQKHMLHELDTKLNSALINWKYFIIYVCEHFLFPTQAVHARVRNSGLHV
jgi:hypothetical protein